MLQHEIERLLNNVNAISLQYSKLQAARYEVSTNLHAKIALQGVDAVQGVPMILWL
jgi:hypothetical protein